MQNQAQINSATVNRHIQYRANRNRLIRKSIHFLTGIALFGLTFLLDHLALLAVIVAGSVFAFVSYWSQSFQLIHKTRNHSLGTLFYPLGVLIAFVLLYQMPIEYFRASLLVLAVSDTMANALGRIRPGNIFFNPLKEEKSLYGIVAFAVSTLIIFYVLLPDAAVWHYLILATLLAIVFEIFSWRGSDNLSIPVGSALFFIVMDRHESDLVFLILLVLVAGMGAFLLNRFRLLEKQASALVFFMAVYFTGALGFSWVILIVSFFVTSVLFTIVRARKSRNPSALHGRNTWQVLANSVWAIWFSAAWLITGNEILVLLYVSVVAAVTADTWASEIGPLFHRRCFSLYHRRMKPSGINGGVSMAGSLAALAGAVFIAGMAYWLFAPVIDSSLVILLALSGFLASFADSLLGAFVEDNLERWIGSFDNVNGLTANDLINVLGSLAAPVLLMLGIIIMEVVR
ncbi:MAG: DUF92 domain-containing protein [Bacteroidales bacterium]